MCRALLIFMLFLLPLRGLVGDAMAYSMLPAGLPVQSQAMQDATYSVAAYALFTKASGSIAHQSPAQSSANPPCHMDMAGSDDSSAPQSQCTTCQACHLSAATPMQLPGGILHTSAALPTQRPALWISAEPRLLAKTPVL